MGITIPRKQDIGQQHFSEFQSVPRKMAGVNI